MERTRRLTVVQAGFPWSDLGSWADLHEARREAGEADGDDSVVLGDGLAVESQRCLVDAGGGRLGAVVGAEDLVVVDTGDAGLGVPAARGQSVRGGGGGLPAGGRGGVLWRALCVGGVGEGMVVISNVAAAMGVPLGAGPLSRTTVSLPGATLSWLPVASPISRPDLSEKWPLTVTVCGVRAVECTVRLTWSRWASSSR